MMEVTSGDYVIKETQLTSNDADHMFYMKETELTDWNDGGALRKITSGYSTCAENSRQPSFNDICDEFQKFLGEDSSSNEGDVKDAQDTSIKETEVHSKALLIKKKNFVTDTNLKFNGNSKRSDLCINYENAKETEITENYDSSKDKTFANEESKLILSYDGDNTSFQDIDNEFFETDYENVDNSVKICERVDLDERVNFQDIESDFFETDCETTEKPSSAKNTDSKLNASKQDKKNEANVLKRSIFKNDEISREKKPVRRNLFENKSEAMSNVLLRSTINELEKALNDSNILLAKRDQKIQDLRSENMLLKKNLCKEMDVLSQTKLKLLEKEALLSEHEVKIVELRRELSVVNEKLSNVRLYELNNDYNYYENYNDTELNKNENLSTCFQKFPCSTSKSETDQGDSENRKTSISNKESLKTQSVCPYRNSLTNRDKSNNSDTHQRKEQKANQIGSAPQIDERVSKTELHSNLRMRFMRDAFFYYMIGFHPDEQINAILAILNYGDKRQDFVLEAHKMKQKGKKFNVTKVSSRELTFVQHQTEQ